MRKVILVLCFILLVPRVTHAGNEVTKESRPKFGLMGGILNFDGGEIGIGIKSVSVSGFSGSFIITHGMQNLHIPKAFHENWVNIVTIRGRLERRFTGPNSYIYVGFIAYDAWRDAKVQDALDCLYCTNIFAKLDIPINYYLEIGGVFNKAIYVSMLLRITDHKGFYREFGSDPYGVAGSIDRSCSLHANPFVVSAGIVWWWSLR